MQPGSTRMIAAGDAMVSAWVLAAAVAWPAAAQRPDAEHGDDSATSQVYLDEAARHLMEGARAARDSALSDIESYTALVRERGSVEASVLVRDRPVARFESATRVRWSRDGPTVLRVLGSRMGIGGQRLRPRQPEGIAARFAADPLLDPFGLFIASGFGSESRKSWFVPSVTPLDDDAERFYQFRSGDTISVTLAGGRSVQAIGVTASPRFRDLGLAFAVMWIEPETFGLVRAIYRPAKPMKSEVSFRFGGDWEDRATGCGAIPAWCCAGAKCGEAAPSCNARSACLPSRSSTTGRRSMAAACSRRESGSPSSTGSCARTLADPCHHGTRPAGPDRTPRDGRDTCGPSHRSERYFAARRVIRRSAARLFLQFWHPWPTKPNLARAGERQYTPRSRMPASRSSTSISRSRIPPRASWSA